MGRLEDVIERDKRRRKMTSRRVVIIGVFVLVIATIILMTFTNLGMPKPIPHQKPTHVDGIYLRGH